MNEYTIVAFFTNLVYFSIALIVVLYILRRFDKLAGINFKEHVWPKLLENPLALGIYLGFRILAICELGRAFL